MSAALYKKLFHTRGQQDMLHILLLYTHKDLHMGQVSNELDGGREKVCVGRLGGEQLCESKVHQAGRPIVRDGGRGRDGGRKGGEGKEEGREGGEGREGEFWL